MSVRAAEEIVDFVPRAERFSPREPIRSRKPYLVSKGRVLLVDDSAEILDVYARILRAAGFAVLEVSDGRRVDEALVSFRPDAVLTDVVMPVVDGVQVLQAVRQRNPDTAVVLMSGAADLGSALKAVELGAFRYLQKPVDSAALTQVVEDAVGVRRLSEVKRRALDEFRCRSDQRAARADLVSRFEHALQTVHMVYQPIVRWSDRTIFGHEALVRTHEATLCEPRDLLFATSALGRLHDLGRVVRASIAKTMQEHPESGPILVNVHPLDLDDSDLLTGESPLAAVANRVVLEVTEWASLDLLDDVQSRFSALRRQGYRLALDDLGAGYAGLTSFAQLRPEIVKLDMSLTRGVTEEPIKLKLIESMMSLCQELGLFMIAEGVETSQERDALVGLGCDLFQGYFFARPAFPFPDVNWPRCAARGPRAGLAHETP